jgi:hypothetical protein
LYSKAIVHFLNRIYAVFFAAIHVRGKQKQKEAYVRKLFLAAYKNQRFLYV